MRLAALGSSLARAEVTASGLTEERGGVCPAAPPSGRLAPYQRGEVPVCHLAIEVGNHGPASNALGFVEQSNGVMRTEPARIEERLANARIPISLKDEAGDGALVGVGKDATHRAPGRAQSCKEVMVCDVNGGNSLAHHAASR